MIFTIYVRTGRSFMGRVIPGQYELPLPERDGDCQGDPGFHRESDNNCPVSGGSAGTDRKNFGLLPGRGGRH